MALSGSCRVVDRTQALVLGFFVLVWISLVAIFVVVPEVYEQALRLPSASGRSVGLAFLIRLSAFIALLGVGALQRWRWTFWLIMVAFLFGVLRVPAFVLGFTGVLPKAGPTWYVLYQALLGLVQFSIGLLMVVGYRRGGTWGT